MYCLLHNILHSYCTLTARCTAHLLQATFLRAMDWKGVHELLIDAAVLKKTSTGGAAVQVERMMAMLALTAVHDIMKCEVLLPTALRVDLCADRPDRACHNICYLSLQVLLPTVLPEHAPFCGFAAGDVINDHDVALGYVLQVLQRT